MVPLTERNPVLGYTVVSLRFRFLESQLNKNYENCGNEKKMKN